MNIVEPIREKRDLKRIESILKKQSFRDLLIFTVGINCGLRISDIVALNVGDVQNKSYIQIVEKKTGKYKRFPVNSKLKPMFEKFTQGREADEPLFLSVFSFHVVATGHPAAKYPCCTLVISPFCCNSLNALVAVLRLIFAFLATSRHDR